MSWRFDNFGKKLREVKKEALKNQSSVARCLAEKIWETAKPLLIGRARIGIFNHFFTDIGSDIVKKELVRVARKDGVSASIYQPVRGGDTWVCVEW